MTSKTHQLKNAMRVYAAELICSTGVSWAFRLLNLCFACIINCVDRLKFKKVSK